MMQIASAFDVEINEILDEKPEIEKNHYKSIVKSIIKTQRKKTRGRRKRNGPMGTEYSESMYSAASERFHYD